MNQQTHETSGLGLSWLTLFASAGTLICCALPILLVSLGLGSVVAALTSNLPILIALSEQKAWMFTGSALMLALLAWVLWRPSRACANASQLSALCSRAQRWNRRVFWGSLSIWCVGFFAAYLLYPLILWWDAP